VIYLVDRVVQPLNNWGQKTFTCTCVRECTSGFLCVIALSFDWFSGFCVLCDYTVATEITNSNFGLDLMTLN